MQLILREMHVGGDSVFCNPSYMESFSYVTWLELHTLRPLATENRLSSTEHLLPLYVLYLFSSYLPLLLLA